MDGALEVCPGEYLEETLRLATHVQVIVALGKKARNWFCEHAEPALASNSELDLLENVRIKAAPQRTFTYLALGHPSSGEKRLPKTVLESGLAARPNPARPHLSRGGQRPTRSERIWLPPR